MQTFGLYWRLMFSGNFLITYRRTQLKESRSDLKEQIAELCPLEIKRKVEAMPPLTLNAHELLTVTLHCFCTAQTQKTSLEWGRGGRRVPSGPQETHSNALQIRSAFRYLRTLKTCHEFQIHMFISKQFLHFIISPLERGSTCFIFFYSTYIVYISTTYMGNY